MSTIDPLPSGKFRVRAYVNGKQETIGTFPTLTLAERAAAAHEHTMAETSSLFEGANLREFGPKVLTAREISRRIRDPQSDWSRWKHHVAGDVVSQIGLKKLRATHGYQWLGRLEGKGIAAQTRRNCLNLVRVVLEEAVRQGLVPSNPFHGIRVAGKSTHTWTYLSVPEVELLLAALGDVERHIVGFAIGTGLRAGELVSLRLADVHLGDGRPRLVVRYGSPPDRPTKTGKVRTVPLFGPGLSVVRSWVEGGALERFCPKSKNARGLVFPGERGGYRSKDHIIGGQAWKSALEKAGLGRRFRWHDLRHTCASWLVSGWWGRRWSLSEVMEMLGHTSISVTQRYAHLAESALEQAARATPGLTEGPREPPDIARHTPALPEHTQVGGGEGIRTLGADNRAAVFKVAASDRSEPRNGPRDSDVTYPDRAELRELVLRLYGAMHTPHGRGGLTCARGIAEADVESPGGQGLGRMT